MGLHRRILCGRLAVCRRHLDMAGGLRPEQGINCGCNRSPRQHNHYSDGVI